MRHNRNFAQPRRPISKLIRVWHGTPLYNDGHKVVLLGFWMKGCFFGAQFLNKRRQLFNRFLIGDVLG
jgi:hypothetical protein